jgi:TetR/AcrR family acrAB operon transcriptional repressor
MRRSKEDALQTREDLMNAALALFIKNGYSKTSQDDIVNELGLTRGAFQGHFSNKEDLFRQLMSQEFDFISGLVTDSFIRADDPALVLRSLLENVIDNFYSNKRFRNFVYLTWFRVEVDEKSKVLKDKTDFNEYFLEQVHQILKKARASGILAPSCTPKIAALQITALINGIYRLYFVTPNYLSDKRVAHRICRELTDQLFRS